MNKRGILTSKKLVIAFAIIVALMFMMEPLSGNIGGNTTQSTGVTSGTASAVATPISASPSAPAPTSADGTFRLAQVGNPDYVNYYEASTVCDFYILDLLYSSATTELPNGSYIYCLADNYTVSTPSTPITTFDPLTGATNSVYEIYTVHIRPGVEWSDYTSANAGDTYVYSNYTSFTNASGVAFSHTYTRVYNATSQKYQAAVPITMKTEYVQAADFILSWKLLNEATDLSGEYAHVVNVMPLNNLTVEYFLDGPSGIFVPDTLETPILPYHIWVSHDYASAGSGLWNETTTGLSSSNAYNEWDMGHVGAFGAGNGLYPGLVGTGPFMMNGGYGEPAGQIFTSDYWSVYANPHFFLRSIGNTVNDSTPSTVTPSLDVSQFAPKVYSINVSIYASPSGAVGALSTGKVNAIESDLSSEFLPTVEGIPDAHILKKPSTGYAYFKFNSYSVDAPYNITAFRQALRMASPLGYIQSSICDGYLAPGYSTIPEIDSPYYYSAVPAFSYNPTAANNTIASIPGMAFKSGHWYYDGTEVTATIQSPSSSLIPQIYTGYETIASDWDAIGIATTIESESFSTEITHLDAYDNAGASPSTSYNVITLGVSGLLGDTAFDVIDDYNYSSSVGTGDYQGPFSGMNVTTPLNSVFKIPDKYMTGTQIDSLMTNLTNIATSTSSIRTVVAAMDIMQYIEDNESTMMPIGYGPEDNIVWDNNTFTGITNIQSDIDGFWYYNEMAVHLVSYPIVTVKPVAHAIVTGYANQTVLTDGQYGEVTYIATDNATGKPIANATVSITEEPSILNITSYVLRTNSSGMAVYKFQVSPDNAFINVPGYGGVVPMTATVVPTNTSIASGVGVVNIDDLPVGVAYKISGPSALSGSSYKYYNITIYNPLTDKPIVGYEYTIQAMRAAILMKRTSSDQAISNISTYSSLCDYTELSVPVNSTYNSTMMTSVTGQTGSNGNISVMIAVNSTFNYTLNGNNVLQYIYLGDYALDAPVYGEAPYMDIGEVTSSQNANGYGAGEPIELPVELEHSMNNYTVTVTHKNVSPAVTELIYSVTDNGKAVSGYNLNVTSQNALGANRGYFLNSSLSMTNPNYYLLTTCGPETGSEFEPAAHLVTNADGMAYVNFTSLYYTYNATGVITPEAVNSPLLPFDEFQISAYGTGAVAIQTIAVPQNEIDETYNVTVTETGVPVNVTWMVIVNGAMLSTNTTSLIFPTLPNGTYAYSAGYANAIYLHGLFTINGDNITVALAFPVPTYNVTFVADNITNGASWMIELNNTNNIITYSNVTLSNTTHSTSMLAYLPDGTYNFTARAFDYKYISGQVIVDGKNVTIPLTFVLQTYKVTFKETELALGTTWYVNVTEGNGTTYSSPAITGSSYSMDLANETYTYVPSANDYYGIDGMFTVNGVPENVSVMYMKDAHLELNVTPTNALVSINGVNVTLTSGVFSGYFMEGNYYITINEAGYSPYSNLVHLSFNKTYSYDITLKSVTNFGYLTGIVTPLNATITANGVGIPVMNGYFNVSLSAGTYYVAVTAFGYKGYVTSIVIVQGKATPLVVTLPKIINSVSISGYVTPVNSSVTVNGLVAYVNATGFYDISTSAGKVTISAFEAGYYPYSKVMSVSSSMVLNITLIKEPKPTSTITVNNTVAAGFNVTVTNLVIHNNYTSFVFNATVNGIATVNIPRSEIINVPIIDILNSRVYIDGTLYTNFSITISSSGAAILTVYNLTGDPSLVWAYSPSVAAPSYYTVTFTETGLSSGASWSVTFNGVTEKSTTSSIVFTNELNGTYSYTVGSVASYKLIKNGSGTVTVSGANQTVDITYKHIVNYTDDYIIGGVVAAIVIIGLAAFFITRKKK